ncbi:uncharacterized protein BDR25DRAFT_293481 [Lindgomyces ingoldianus]|uniref:Uncharacterized protein n=1 Tax=Lindgomyces ingoldianus TaxID=673940 RepID=A0ACB6QHT4_9PLEO|nr:uncharacterized protein BDR25DRAFT_293481 [Lindgomyces ingoldianus]KAF2466549.1 hypothetical protein BDR25DRAFT_293481 [Lindgomyces ingoldianus]
MFPPIVLLFFTLSLSTLIFAETIDYKNLKTPAGDKLPNFSFAGYHQSEIPLPALTTPANKTLSPGSGDQAPVIQAALDSVKDSGGGVVELKAGTYALSSGLLIHSQTTLRGAGIGKTVLTVKNLEDNVVTLGKQTNGAKRGDSVKITDTYVPAGTSTVHVSDASRFKVGQEVFIERGVTQMWIDEMGMTPHTKWLPPGTLVPQPRLIASISGKAISFTIPLTDSLNATNSIMTPIQLTPYVPPTQPSEIGIENLSMRVSPSCSGIALGNTTCSASAVRVSSWTSDSWVRNLDLTGFNNHITTGQYSARITITNITMNRNGATDNSAGYALDIAIDGTQTLIHNCKTLGAKDAKSFGVATQSLTPGPNACIGYEAQQAVESVEPHQRWAHGFLNEGSKVAAVLLRNRGAAGSGHGWTVNNAVSYNTNASAYTIQNPPLGQNYCIGCVGPKDSKQVNNGTFLSYGKFVDPPSLFEAQLKDRGFDFKI